MYKVKESLGERVFGAINIFFILIVCAITLYPFLHVFSVAFSTQSEAIRPGLHLYPKEVDLASIKKVLGSADIWRAYGVTLTRAIIGTILSVSVTGMGAYALSKSYLPLKKAIMMLILFSMFFTGGMVPTYLLIKALGLMGSIWSMILPSLVWGFNIIIMKNFFAGIPASLDESAMLDGAGEFTIFAKIYFPLSKPVIATVAMWMAVHHWNSYFDNLIYITDNKMYVLQRMIRSLVIDVNALSTESMQGSASLSPESLKAATIVVAIVPIILVYPFVQKYFIKGVMLGSVKG